MNRHIPLLAGLLVAQLLLALILFWPKSQDAGLVNWPSLEAAEVTEIQLSSADGETLVLQRQTAGWMLTDWKDPAQAQALLETPLPADANRVRTLLAQLTVNPGSWPVASSQSAARRFGVDDAGFAHRVQLRVAAETRLDLLLGTSPAFRRMHGRLAGSDAILNLELAGHEISARADDWLDKGALRPEGALDQVQLVAMPTEAGTQSLTLQREGDNWHLLDATSVPTLDQGAVDALLSRLRNLRVQGLSVQQATDANAILAVHLQDAQGELSYQIYPQPTGVDYLIRSSRLPGLFRIAAFQVEPLLLTRDDLLAAEVAAEVTVETAIETASETN